MRRAVGSMNRGVSDRDNPWGQLADNRPPSTTDVPAFEWPPSDEFINQRVVEFKHEPDGASDSTSDASVANQSNPEPAEQVLAASAVEAVRDEYAPEPPNFGRHSDAPSVDVLVAGPEPASSSTSQSRPVEQKRGLPPKEVWAAAVRSLDVIAAVAALIVTVATGLTIRLGKSSRLRRWTSPVRYPVRYPPVDQRRPRLSSLRAQPTFSSAARAR